MLNVLLTVLIGAMSQKPTAALPKAPTSGTLVIAVLSVRSSYSANTETRGTGVTDTVQWWLDDHTLWRITTFALDHDIHIYSLPRPAGDAIRLAVENTRKHYGDVIRSTHTVAFPALGNAKQVNALLRREGLSGVLEISPKGFAFWNPDNAVYRTQSTPR